MTGRAVIIDTDPGLGQPGSDIDDGLAIALALRSPELDVLGLTIVNGNVDEPVGVNVARRLAARLGRSDLPVLSGAKAPLVRTMGPIRDLFASFGAHASTADSEPSLGPTSDEPAADFLCRIVRARPGAVTVIAIGPMTNLAHAIQQDRTFARNVGELVLMAGSATGYAHNVTTVGDFNTYVDPEALHIVLNSGARVRMVGIDQTSRVELTLEDADWLSTRGDDFGRYVGECARAWIAFLGSALPGRPEHQTACFLHDPLVVGAVIDPQLLTWADAHVQTELSSELARGLVVADLGLSLTPHRPWNARVATDTAVAPFRRLLLDRLITQPDAVDVDGSKTAQESQ